MTASVSEATRAQSSPEVQRAIVALCQSVLPVWGRHLDTARDHAEVAVAEMLSAFSDIAPQLDMAMRQSQELNAVLQAPEYGLGHLAQVCDGHLLPLIPNLDAEGAVAVHHVLETVHRTIAALGCLAKPFDHEARMVSLQVERMYVGLQYQDRISQMMTLLSDDMNRLQLLLADPDANVADMAQDAWMAQLESRYAMDAQRNAHEGGSAAPSSGLETDFF